MVRTRFTPRRGNRPSNFNINTQCGRYARGKEIAGRTNRGNFKITFLLPQNEWKTVHTKDKKKPNEVREMTVRRYAKYLAKKKRGTY